MPQSHGEHFADRLFDAINRHGAPACVGLDPVLEKLPAALRTASRSPADSIEEFCRGVIDAVAGIVPAIKPQSACFERYGAEGFDALERTVAHARSKGLIVVLDAKRGDIGVSADHYAAWVFDRLGADAVTVNGYLGPDTIRPFLRAADAGRKGVFVLVRTSNPGSDAVQGERLEDGRSVAEMLAGHVARLGAEPGLLGRCGLSAVGAVVAATKPTDAAAMRARMPDSYFLVPGYGAQGGTLDDCRNLARRGAGGSTPGSLGVLITASRSVIYPAASGTADWVQSIRAAAMAFRAELTCLVS